jgi:hypothetical protein
MSLPQNCDFTTVDHRTFTCQREGCGYKLRAESPMALRNVSHTCRIQPPGTESPAPPRVQSTAELLDEVFGLGQALVPREEADRRRTVCRACDEFSPDDVGRDRCPRAKFCGGHLAQVHRYAGLRDAPPVCLHRVEFYAGVGGPPPPGVGDHFHRLAQTYFGLDYQPDCGCSDLADLMNRWGPAGCRKNLAKLVDRLQRKATEAGWLVAALASFPGAFLGIAWLVEQAIAAAEAEPSGVPSPGESAYPEWR